MKLTQMHGFITQILLTSIFMHFCITIAQPVEFIYSQCDDNIGNFTKNSAFQKHLNASLGVLYANTAESGGFYSSTIGRSRNVVHSQFICRGDLTPEVCRTCVKFAIQDLISSCTNQRGAVIWYTVCTLRWSNKTMVGIMNVEPAIYMSNHFVVDDITTFQSKLADFMDGLVGIALSSSKLFAVGVVNSNTNGDIYGLVQCTPDISKEDCRSCLNYCNGLLPTCCGLKRGGRVMTPSCFVRFELYSFFYSVAQPPFIAPTPAPSPIILLPPPSTDPINVIIGKQGTSSKKKKMIIAIVAASIAIIALLLLILFCSRTRKANKNLAVDLAKTDISSSEPVRLDIRRVKASTSNFSANNKIGEGRFGTVYKGKLFDGREIAVKRLSVGGKDVNEFKREAMLVAKLQHRNLVKLLGFFMQADEKLLVYEFVPNKSLDYFLFDPTRRRDLDWSKRQKIIEGIARGLLYLHEDSRFKVVHRDLKPCNILLDEDMTPKISDFGMARIFEIDNMEKVTDKIAGTLGYMSPEYGMLGQYSQKSDIYSFGIIILEIISGTRNHGVSESNEDENLIHHTWRHWGNGTPNAIVDPIMLSGVYSEDEVNRYIHVGLLCVQEDAADRPTIGTILPMLTDMPMSLPKPKIATSTAQNPRKWV